VPITDSFTNPPAACLTDGTYTVILELGRPNAVLPYRPFDGTHTVTARAAL